MELDLLGLLWRDDRAVEQAGGVAAMRIRGIHHLCYVYVISCNICKIYSHAYVISSITCVDHVLCVCHIMQDGQTVRL